MVALRCKYCGKYLKETEAYYLHNECSDCNYQHNILIYKKTKS